MQNLSLKSRQSSITSEKPGYSFGKFWRAPTTIEFNIFCWNFAHLSFLPVSTKGCSWFFILSRFRVIDKPGLCESVETKSFCFGK